MMIFINCVLTFLLLGLFLISELATADSPWANWWAYEGVAGPSDWGYLNPEWVLCRSGKFQSPINIEPRLLLFDPKLRRMNVDIPDTVSGLMQNAGNDIIFTLDDIMMNAGNFSDGPLMYAYRLSQIKLHIGKTNTKGSEHKVDDKSFGAEVHLICYNSDLSKSLQEAKKMPYGAAIIAIFAEISGEFEPKNSAFKLLVDHATKIPWQGQTLRVENFSIKSLIPNTSYYITYEGSFTQPGCQETVTWVLFNRPIFIDASQLDVLRRMQYRQKDKRMTLKDGNLRPVMPLHNRAVRTNINYPTAGGICDMRRLTFYEMQDKMRH